MIYCNEIMSLSVLSLYEGEMLGIINKIYFDKNLKKIEKLEIISENGIKLLLKIKNIYKIGKNAITVKNNQAVSIAVDEEDLVTCPIGAKTYSINGEYIGVIKEIVVNDKFVSQDIVLENGESLKIENVASCGKNTVIFSNNKKINVKQFQPISSPREYISNNVQAVEVQPVKKSEALEMPFEDNSTFLIGRRCKKEITNFNNEILIKANGIVNKKNLKEIKKFGKLRELMLYCK